MGVFTSASKRTVDAALAVLEEAAGPGPRLFDRSLVLHRVHTQPVDRVRPGAAACREREPSGLAWGPLLVCHFVGMWE